MCLEHFSMHCGQEVKSIVSDNNRNQHDYVQNLLAPFRLLKKHLTPFSTTCQI